MALAAAQSLVIAGLTPAYAVPLASEAIVAAPNQFLHVKNTNAALTLVTIDDKGITPSGSAATDPSVSVPATTGDRMIPLAPTFSDPLTGLITVTFSNIAAGVTAAVIRFP